MVADPQEMGKIPIQLGKDVYLRDVATIEDTTDINYGCALVNGRKSIFIPVVKKDTASTLTVVEQIHDTMPEFRSLLPKDVDIRYEFDESPTVRAAIKSVATEGAIGAGLTGLMILLFLHDLRSVIVVLISIPLSLTSSLVGLWLTGNTINIMTLGGLALAIGILVDEATVTIENTHAQMRRTQSIARAAQEANATTNTARLLAMLCILSVFIPAFILNEPVRSLFMPLTLAVGFAMIASYLLSSTLVPVLTVWLVRHAVHDEHKVSLFDRFLDVFVKVVTTTVRHRWAVVGTYLAACGVLIVLVGSRVSTELFPEVDSGQFVLRFRAPPGTEYDLTRRCAVQILERHQRRERRQRGDVDRLYGHGLHEHGHQQHSLVHAGQRRRRAPRAVEGRQRRLRRQASRPLARVASKKSRAVAERLLGETRRSRGRGRGAVEADDVRFRAGRHRQHRDEFRLAESRRSPGDRAGTRGGQDAHLEDPRTK